MYCHTIKRIKKAFFFAIHIHSLILYVSNTTDKVTRVRLVNTIFLQKSWLFTSLHKLLLRLYSLYSNLQQFRMSVIKYIVTCLNNWMSKNSKWNATEKRMHYTNKIIFFKSHYHVTLETFELTTSMYALLFFHLWMELF